MQIVVTQRTIFYRTASSHLLQDVELRAEVTQANLVRTPQDLDGYR